MGRLVHTGLGSSSLVAHVLHYPPPHANSCVIGPAVIKHTPFSPQAAVSAWETASPAANMHQPGAQLARSRLVGQKVCASSRCWSDLPRGEAHHMCVCLLLQYLIQTELFALGEGDSGGHVLRETTCRHLSGLVCPSHTSEHGGEGDCVREGGAIHGRRVFLGLRWGICGSPIFGRYPWVLITN
jgi:hypothetical protein